MDLNGNVAVRAPAPIRIPILLSLICGKLVPLKWLNSVQTLLSIRNGTVGIWKSVVEVVNTGRLKIGLPLLMAPNPWKISVVFIVCSWESERCYEDCNRFSIANSWILCNCPGNLRFVTSTVKKSLCFYGDCFRKHSCRYCLELNMWSNQTTRLIVTASVVLVTVIVAWETLQILVCWVLILLIMKSVVDVSGSWLLLLNIGCTRHLMRLPVMEVLVMSVVALIIVVVNVCVVVAAVATDVVVVVVVCWVFAGLSVVFTVTVFSSLWL